MTRVDWPALWDVLKIYGVRGKLLWAVKSFYEEASAWVKIRGETSEHFEIKVGLRQGCVMSPWLFNIYMDGVMRKVKGKVGKVAVRMYNEGGGGGYFGGLEPPRAMVGPAACSASLAVMLLGLPHDGRLL